MEIASLKIKPIATETSLRMQDQKAEKSYQSGNFLFNFTNRKK